MANLNWIQSNFNLLEVDTFILSGCSAGGLAAYTWVDFFHDRIKAINPNINFMGYTDSGIFPVYQSQKTDDNHYQIAMKSLYEIINEETPFP